MLCGERTTTCDEALSRVHVMWLAHACPYTTSLLHACHTTFSSIAWIWGLGAPAVPPSHCGQLTSAATGWHHRVPPRPSAWEGMAQRLHVFLWRPIKLRLEREFYQQPMHWGTLIIDSGFSSDAKVLPQRFHTHPASKQNRYHPVENVMLYLLV